jgi:hypothetical protein
VGPEPCKILGAHFKKKNTNYEYKIMYERKYLFRMRKEITTNYEFIKKTDRYHKHHNIQKNNTVFLLIN